MSKYIKPLYRLTEEEIFSIYSGEKNLLEVLKDPSPELLKKMILKIPYNIKYLKNPSQELQMLLFSNGNNKEILKYINNPTRKTIVYACQKAHENIQYVDDLTEEEKREIIKENPHAISEIEEPSLDLLLMLPEKGEYYSLFVRNLDHLNEEEQLILLDKTPRYFEKIRRKGEKVLLWRIKRGGFHYIKGEKITPKIREEALKNSGWAMQYIKDLTEEEILECWRNIIFDQEHNDFFEKLLTKPWVFQVANYLERQYYKKKLSFSSKRELKRMIREYQKFPKQKAD